LGGGRRRGGKGDKVEVVDVVPTVKPVRPQMICFRSVLAEYKLPALPENVVPKKCEVSCKRLHYGQIPKGALRKPLVDIATTIKLVSEDTRKLLLAAIKADSKFK
jgi:hypothetical protein